MIKIGLDVRIVMVKNRKQVEQEGFWDICRTGWVEDADGRIDFSAPSEVYYARKFWDLYTPVARALNLENGEYSQPLTEEDVEFILNIASHNKDNFGGFNTVPQLCEILDRYEEIKENGMVLLFEGDF